MPSIKHTTYLIRKKDQEESSTNGVQYNENTGLILLMDEYFIHPLLIQGVSKPAVREIDKNSYYSFRIKTINCEEIFIGYEFEDYFDDFLPLDVEGEEYERNDISESEYHFIKSFIDTTYKDLMKLFISKSMIVNDNKQNAIKGLENS